MIYWFIEHQRTIGKWFHGLALVQAHKFSFLQCYLISCFSWINSSAILVRIFIALEMKINGIAAEIRFIGFSKRIKILIVSRKNSTKYSLEMLLNRINTEIECVAKCFSMTQKKNSMSDKRILEWTANVEIYAINLPRVYQTYFQALRNFGYVKWEKSVTSLTCK